MLIHYMVVEKCVFCVCTLGVGDLLKSGSISAQGIVWGHYFHKQLVHFFAFAARKVVPFFLAFLFTVVLFWLGARYAASCMHMCCDICAFDVQDKLAIVFFEPILFLHPCKARNVW
jgi:hypothetical protein